MAKWARGERFDLHLNGYPITRDGVLVAVAIYSGGTEPAKENADLIIRALDLVERRLGGSIARQEKQPCLSG